MLQWILEHIGIVVVAIVFLVQIMRGLLGARKTASERETKRDDGSEERRTREVQEQIRRQIAERRGGRTAGPAPPPTTERESGPMPRPETTQMPDPFGGPLGRMLEELQKKVQSHLPPQVQPPVLAERRHAAEFERQQQLADQLKVAEESRALVQRRAAHLAADQQTEAQSEPALRSVARERLLRDLGDAESLRRAFVLREVLGTPVGLR